MNNGWHWIFFVYRQLVTGNRVQIKYFDVDRATQTSTNNQLHTQKFYLNTYLLFCKLPSSPPRMADGIVYDEAWNETAELLISDEVKESAVEKSGIGGGEKA